MPSMSAPWNHCNELGLSECAAALATGKPLANGRYLKFFNVYCGFAGVVGAPGPFGSMPGFGLLSIPGIGPEPVAGDPG